MLKPPPQVAPTVPSSTHRSAAARTKKRPPDSARRLHCRRLSRYRARMLVSLPEHGPAPAFVPQPHVACPTPEARRPRVPRPSKSAPQHHPPRVPQPETADLDVFAGAAAPILWSAMMYIGAGGAQAVVASGRRLAHEVGASLRRGGNAAALGLATCAAAATCVAAAVVYVPTLVARQAVPAGVLMESFDDSEWDGDVFDIDLSADFDLDGD